MHLGGKAVADAFLRARGNLNAIASGSEITNHFALFLKIPQATSHEIDGDRVWLVICEGNQRLGWMTIDELDTEDLRGGKGSFSRNSEFYSLRFRNLLSIL